MPAAAGGGEQRVAVGRYAEKRLQVVDAAAHVFARQGYHRTTIDDIVEATGLTRGGLYYYIAGKKDLLIASHERYLTPLLAETERIAAQDAPPSETIRRILEAMMRTHASYPDHVAVFLNEWKAIQSEPEWNAVRRDRRTFERLVADVLTRGRAAGDFHFEDPSVTLFALLGMVNYAYQWFNPRGRLGADELAGRFSDIFLDGVRGPR